MNLLPPGAGSAPGGRRREEDEGGNTGVNLLLFLQEQAQHKIEACLVIEMFFIALFYYYCFNEIHSKKLL